MEQPSPSPYLAPDDLPLKGVRVLEISHMIMGPATGMTLADLGAEVIKVEPVEGDRTRRLKSAGIGYFPVFNRNKQSFAVDLKSAEGRKLVQDLADKADIVLENLRPGVMDKLGLGYADLRELNPGLIYVAISGYGHGDVKPSPYTEYPAFDIVAQALSGLMYRPERSGDRPIYLGVSLGDIQAGIVAAQGALLALLQRGKTGKGQKVDVSLYDAALVINELPIAMYSVFKEKYPPGAHALTAPFGTYRTADGYIVIAVLGEHVWQRFCEAIGQPQLAHDERFKDGLSRRNNQKTMDAHIEPWLLARTRAEAVQALLDHGVPASVVNDVDDLFTCPHIAARDMLVQIDDPLWGRVQIPGNPIKMSDTPDIPLAHPPRLGEHTDEVLAGWLGLAPADVAALRERKVV